MERVHVAEVSRLQQSLQEEGELKRVSEGALQELRAEVAIGMEDLPPLQEEGQERSTGECVHVGGGKEGGGEGQREGKVRRKEERENTERRRRGV